VHWLEFWHLWSADEPLLSSSESLKTTAKSHHPAQSWARRHLSKHFKLLQLQQSDLPSLRGPSARAQICARSTPIAQCTRCFQHFWSTGNHWTWPQVNPSSRVSKHFGNVSIGC
jgi:hypothetical protein